MSTSTVDPLNDWADPPLTQYLRGGKRSEGPVDQNVGQAIVPPIGATEGTTDGATHAPLVCGLAELPKPERRRSARLNGSLAIRRTAK